MGLVENLEVFPAHAGVIPNILHFCVISFRISRTRGGDPKWQKISGITKIKFKGKSLKVEIHWYESNGQREEIKIKRIFDDES